MINHWHSEVIAGDYTVAIPGKQPELYWIKTDNLGERTFYYWREQSAARKLMRSIEPKQLQQQIYKRIYNEF